MPHKLKHDPDAWIIRLAVAFEQMHERVKACETWAEMVSYHGTAVTVRSWLDVSFDYDPHNPLWVRVEDAVMQVLIITTTMRDRQYPPVSILGVTDLNVAHYRAKESS